jgi:hypothetical protein
MTVVLLYAPVDNVQPGVVFQAPGLEFTQWIVLSMIAVAAFMAVALTRLTQSVGMNFKKRPMGRIFGKSGGGVIRYPQICRTPIAHPILI